jgi:hypothetical protein
VAKEWPGIPLWKEQKLEKDYLQWLYKRRGPGREPVPFGPVLRDPHQFYIPSPPEVERRRIGALPDLEEELTRLRAVRVAQQPYGNMAELQREHELLAKSAKTSPETAAKLGFPNANPKRQAELARQIKELKVGYQPPPVQAGEIAKEVNRLRVQEADIAWTQAAREADEQFVRESYQWERSEWKKRAAAKPPEGPKGLHEVEFPDPAKARFKAKAKPKAGFRKLLTKRNLLIAGGALLAGALLLPKREHNTIEGLHPDSDGMGAQVMRSHSDFGSGWLGVRRGGVRVIRRISNLDDFKFSAMGNSETFAGKTREAHTEFKADFASRWDPLRKLAKELFEETGKKSAFKQLTESPQFRQALREGMKGESKLLGKGVQGQVHGYTAQMALGGKTHKFEFAAKRAYTPKELIAQQQSQAPMPEFFAKQEARRGVESLKHEAQVLGELGEQRSPSLYGQMDDQLIMEKFQGLEKLDDGLLLSSAEEGVLSSFIKGAHKKGYRHTDLHGENIVRVTGEGGKREAAVLDWGLANRFVKERGFGGKSSEAWEVSKDIINEEAKKAMGTTVNLRQYVEMADLRRIRAHGDILTGKAESEGIHGMIAAYKARTKPGATAASIAKEEQNLRMAARAVFDKAPMRQTQPAPVGRASSLGMRAEPSAIIQQPPKNIVMPQMNPGSMAGKSHEIRREAGIAATMMMESRVPSVNAYTRTAVMPQNVKEAVKRAIKRNKKFRKRSTQSVGIGLRSANKAGRGHVNYSSTLG